MVSLQLIPGSYRRFHHSQLTRKRWFTISVSICFSTERENHMCFDFTYGLRDLGSFFIALSLSS